jgi:hypothetical protein
VEATFKVDFTNCGKPQLISYSFSFI